MGDDDGSMFFHVAGSNAQVLSTACHERSPSSIVQSDCSLPVVVFVVDGQASEGAKVVLVFSVTVAVQCCKVGIIFYIIRQLAPPHDVRGSVDVHDHIGDSRFSKWNLAC